MLLSNLIHIPPPCFSAFSSQACLRSEWLSIWIRVRSRSQVVWTSSSKDWVGMASHRRLAFTPPFLKKMMFSVIFVGNKMKLLQIKWHKECSGFELKDFIWTMCCCERVRLLLWDGEELRQKRKNMLILYDLSMCAHLRAAHILLGTNWTQCFWLYFMGPWGPDTRIAFQMYNLS